jgi:hypothetical protein
VRRFERNGDGADHRGEVLHFRLGPDSDPAAEVE